MDTPSLKHIHTFNRVFLFITNSLKRMKEGKLQAKEVKLFMCKQHLELCQAAGFGRMCDM